MRTSIWLCALPLLFLLASSSSAENRTTEIYLDAAMADIDHAAIHGPSRIDLGGGAVLALAQHRCFVGNGPTTRYFHVLGRDTDPNLTAGMVFPCGLFSEADWFVMVTIGHDGHVSDNARTWTADYVLHILQGKANALSTSNKRQGLPSVEISGWALPPVYDAAAHRTAWAAIVRAGCPSECPASEFVSYETVILGKDGYVDVFTQPSLKDFPKQKQLSDEISAHISYLPAAQYSDFKPTLDHYASYDLLGLLTGDRSNR